MPSAARDDSTDALRARAEQLELVLRATNEGLFDVDLMAGTVTFSPRWKEMLGYADDEIGTSIRESRSRVHPDDLEPAWRHVSAHLRGETATCEFEHRLRHKDGTYRWFAGRAIATRDASGRAIRLTGSQADITDRRRAAEEVRRRDTMFEAVRIAAERFLRHTDADDEHIGEVLAIFGAAFDVSRVYVFENETDGEGALRCQLRHEWTGAGAASMIVPGTPGMPFGPSCWLRWKELLGQGEPVVGLTRDLPGDEQDELRREGTQSVAVVPIFVDEAWWGFIGFDDCTRERVWSAVEVDALKAAAGTLGAAIGRKRADAISARRDAVLEAVRYAGERFLTPGATWQERVEDVLERLGKAAGVSRTYVSRNERNIDGELCNSVIHEWRLPGIEPWAGNPRYQAIPFVRNGMGAWMETQERGEMLFSHVRDFEAPAGATTRSFVSVPIFVDGAWWGAIGFDESTREWEFPAPERDALKAAADTLGAAIQRELADAASARLAAIVESTNDAIFGMLRNGTITSWNAGAERLYGYTEAETLGRRIHDFVSPEDLARLREVLVALTAGEQADQVEAEVNRKDGTRVWVALTFSLLRDADGNVTGTSAIGRDITDRKRAEDELARRAAILEAVRFAAERFLNPETTWEETLQDVLERLGMATGVSRVYVFENHGTDSGTVLATNTFEWVAPGVAPQIDDSTLRTLSYREMGFGRWVDVLGGGQIMYGHVRELPASERPENRIEDTASFALVPIFVDGRWWGFIGFDTVVHEREFSAPERDALKAAADTLGSAIGRERAKAELARRDAILEAVRVASGRFLSPGMTWEEALTDVLERLGRATGVCQVYVGRNRIDDEGEVWISNIHEWPAPYPPSPESVFPGGVPLRASGLESLLERFSRGETVHGHTHEFPAIIRAYAEAQGVVSWVIVPVFVDGAWWGVIGFDECARERVFSAPERDALKAAADTLGAAIGRERAEAELRESQRSLRTLLSNLPGVAYRRHYVDGGWELDFVSEGSFALSGYHASDLMGPNRIPPTSITHPDDRPGVLAGIDEALARDEPFQVTYRMRTASGGEKWVLDQGRGVRDGSGQLLAIEGIITDVTDRVLARQQLEQRVEERTRELATLLTVSTGITSTLELRPLIGQILDQFGHVVEHVAAAIFLLDGDTHRRLLDYRGPVSQHRLSPVRPLDEVLHSREVVATRQPVIIPDVRADAPLAAAFRADVIHDLGALPEYAASWLGVPLIFRDNVIGLLSVVSPEVDAYTAHDAELALAFASQAAIAIANARLYEQAQGTAALEERQRLARELHDSVSQALFGIGLGARTARTLLDDDPASAAAPLDYVLSLAEAGLTEMRALIFELRPEALEQEGLVVALEKQVATVRARHGIAVEADLGDPGDLSLAVEEAIYRIAQEALNNIVKHARASRVGLALARGGGVLTLAIHDNGAGFDPTASFSGHLGLTTMRERAERLGGTLSLESAPGQGARLRVEIPV